VASGIGFGGQETEALGVFASAQKATLGTAVREALPPGRPRMTDPELIALAQRELTARQFEMWKLHRVNRWSQQTIAYHMDVAKSTVGGTIKRAEQKLELAQREEAA
jgi:DNA-directed RNA polymerase specialized sigma24 family protein